MVFSVDDVDQYSVNDETKLTFEFGSDQQANQPDQLSINLTFKVTPSPSLTISV
jgi:hypothetical protein